MTTDSAVAIALINRFIDQALRYGNEAEDTLLQGNVADPECALMHAYTAAYYLSQEEALSRKRAIPYIRAAQRQLSHLTEREQWTVQAIAAWAAGEIDLAIALQTAIVEKYPRDLFAVQQGQYHHFYRGEVLPLLQIAQRALPANPNNHYLYGMVAFGLEQCGSLSDAEKMARQAVALNRNDPWAHHAIAHVLDTQGRIEEGIAWMEQHADTWADCNSMLYTHNWWHIALYYLSQREFAAVLHLYDRHLWGRARKESPKDQVGAIATLLRLELQGVDVGCRWRDLGPYLLPRLHEHSLPFQDLHYVYALARAGKRDRVNEMLHSMHHYTQTVELSRQAVWTVVAIPAAKGAVAHAVGNWSEAIVYLKAVLPRLHKLGGSHTQRHLFRQLYLDALQKQQNRGVTYNFAS